MKSNNKILLYNAISNIDEEVINNALNYKPRSKTIIKWTCIAACLCAVVFTFCIINKSQNENQNNSSIIIPSADDRTVAESNDKFLIYAVPKNLSDNDNNEIQKVLLSPVKTYLDENAGIQEVNYTVKFKSDGTHYDERDKSYNGEIINQKLFNIKPDPIEFSINSDSIEYYNVKVKNNIICYNSSTTPSDNINIGWSKSIDDICISEDGCLTWQPMCVRYSNEVLSITGKPEPDYDSNINDNVEYSNAAKKVYASIEDFDDYFGDIITFELHYKNGDTENIVVNITLDDNGKYMLDYTIK